MTSRSDKANAPTIFSLVAFMLLLGTHSLPAQSLGEIPMVLHLPASAHIAAMGNAGAASNDGDALLYNPAMIASARGAALSLQTFGSNAMAGAFGSVTAAGPNTYALGAQFLKWRASPLYNLGQVTPPMLADEGGSNALEAVYSAAIARTLLGLRVGAAVKFGVMQYDAQTDGILAFDVGIARTMGPGALTLVAQNLGSGARIGGLNGVLPRRIGLGFGVGIVPFNEYLDVGLQTQILVEEDGFVRPAAGGEVGYVPVEGVAFVLRAGMRNPRYDDESFFTVGAGINVDRYSIDYAMEPVKGNVISHRVGVRVR